jgi:hypothetical protein
MDTAIDAKIKSQIPVRVIYLVVISIFLLIALFMYFYQFRFSLIDDTYITLTYARNLRDNFAWGFYPNEVVNSATSPLNVWLLAFTSIFVRNMEVAAIVLATVVAGALLFLLMRLFAVFDRTILGVIAFVLIIFNPLLVSSLGMETLLYITIVVACLNLYLSQQTRLLGIALAMLVLTRSDGALLFLILHALSPGRRGKLLKWFLVILLPWYLFSYLALGSLLPVTLFIKTGQAHWETWTFANGILLYIQHYPIETITSLLPLIAFVLVIPFAWKKMDGEILHVITILIAFVIAYYSGYSLLSVPPYHWYYAPPLAILILAGMMAAGLISPYIPWLFVPLSFLGLLIIHAPGFPLSEAPIHTNWATASRYKQIATELDRLLPSNERIRITGEVGTLAFYSHTKLCDQFSCRSEYSLTLHNITNKTLLAAAVLNSPWVINQPIEKSQYEIQKPMKGKSKVVKEWACSTKWISLSDLILKDKFP